MVDQGNIKMQAINIKGSETRRKSSAAPLPHGWWLIPALAVSIGLWTIIFKLIF